MGERANVFAIHSWDDPDECRQMEALLRASDSGLAHYSVLPEHAVDGATEDVLSSIVSRIRFATAVLVVNTPGIHRRPFSEFEMRTAVEMEKRIVVVQPPGNFEQPVPSVLDGQVSRYAPWRSDVVGRAIRGEYPHDGRVSDLAEVAERRRIVGLLAAGAAAVSLVVIGNAAMRIRELHEELRQQGVELRWDGDDTAAVAAHAAAGALVVGGLAAFLTEDGETALLAGLAGAAIGAAIAARHRYKARLIGSSRIRVLALDPI